MTCTIATQITLLNVWMKTWSTRNLKMPLDRRSMNFWLSSLSILYKLYIKYVELNEWCGSGYKDYLEGIPLYRHDRPKSLVKHLLLSNNSVTAIMIDSVTTFFTIILFITLEPKIKILLVPVNWSLRHQSSWSSCLPWQSQDCLFPLTKINYKCGMWNSDD